MNSKDKLIFWLIILANTAYNAYLPLHEDEAYYWIWGQQLELSYFDHPSMIAYMLGLFSLISTSEWFIRLVAVGSMAISAWLLHRMAKEAFNEKVASMTLYVFMTTILVQGGFMIVTPDSPLILFWTLALFSGYRYLICDDKKWAYIGGLAIGFAMASKYTGVLLPVALVVYLVLARQWYRFAEKELWACIALAFLAFSPVIIWNYQHEWVSFMFQFDHGVAEEKVFQPELLLEFIGTQAAMFHPFLFVALVVFLFRHFGEFKNKTLFYLLVCFAFPFGFFMYQAMFNESLANWAAPSLISANIIVAYYIAHWNLRKTLIASVALTILAIIIVKFTLFFPIEWKPIQKLHARLVGFHTVMDEMDPAIKVEDYPYLLLGHLHDADVAYELRAGDKAQVITPSRYSQFDIWRDEKFGVNMDTWHEMLADPEKKFPMESALYIGSEDRGKELQSLFNKVELKQTLSYEDEMITRTYYIYDCSNQ